MFEQGINTVKNTEKAINSSFSDARDTVSAYEAVKARRKNSKKTDEKNDSKFKVKKKFSSSSTELARTLGAFNKVLELLESEPEPATDDALSFESRKEFFQEKDVHQNPENKTVTQSDDPQLELNFFPNKDQASIRQNDKPNFDLEIKRSAPIQQSPTIQIDNNPTNFKIQNLITDQIINAISKSNTSVQIVPVSETVAANLASQVKTLLASQPHALATTKETAPVKAFDTST